VINALKNIGGRGTLRVLWGASVLVAVVIRHAWGQEVVLTPEKVVEFAQKNNTAILDAKYEVEEQKHARAAAAAAFKSTLAIRSSYTHLDEQPTLSVDLPFQDEPIEVGPQDMWSIGYVVKQPIFAGGRLILNHRAARLQHESARLVLDRTAEEVRFRALQLFWAYVEAQQRIKTAEKTVIWLERLVGDLAGLVNGGLVVEDEWLRMRTRLALSKLAVVRAGNAARTVGEQLLLFCNLPLHNIIVVDTTALHALEDNPELARPDLSEIVSNRDDIRAMELRIDALEAMRKGKALSYLPSIVGMFSQAIGNTDPQDFHAPENEWSATLSLDWHLIDWGTARYERDKMGAAIAQLRLALDASKRDIGAAIQAARRKVEMAYQAQQLALESVDNAQRALRNADARYREGLITGTDLLSYNKDVTAARVELIRARIEKVLAVEEYRAVVGE